MKKINVKVISDIVCNNLFRNFGPIDDYDLNFIFSPLDQIIPEILTAGDEDFLLLHISQYAFNSYGASESFATNMDEIFVQLENLIRRSNVKLILNTVYFNCEAFSQAELVNKKKMVSTINGNILNFVLSHQSDCVLVDVDNLVSSAGFSNNFSPRNYGVMRFPYSKVLSKIISDKYLFHFKGYFRPRKKVIFVDADNTLWGGVIGEDGSHGVNIGHEYPGSIYYYFQLSLLRLKSSGVVLCLVTKNNESDINDIFQNRDMPLSIDDFVAVKANWDRKSENIGELLDWLNVDASSAVFIDDNPFEIEEVARVHSDIECLKFSLNRFDNVNFVLSNLSDLYAHYLTDEDKAKAASYVEEGHRKSLLNKSGTIDDYLRSLAINMTIYLNDLSLAPRIAQLTQKTNQFNLTTKRYSLAEIQDLMGNQSVFAFSIDDKFGSMGVVGVVIVIENTLDSFLLSCRAFGREIERSMLSLVIQSHDSFPLYSQYSPTRKNVMTKDFYTKNGFEIVSTENNVERYRIDQKPVPTSNFLEKIIWN
jgi:FkbH-like protein